MAHTTQSTVVTDQDAVPANKLSQIKKGAAVRSAYGYLTLSPLTAAQTSAFVRIPARARVVAIELKNVSMGNGSVKIGLFRPNDGIAIDDDVFATAVALTAHEFGANVSTVPTPANAALDLKTAHSVAVGTASATGDVEYDIVLSVVTVSTGAATAVGMEVKYVMPE